MAIPDFIEIDPKADIELLINKYEEETNTTLYPAQDARILINVIAYYGALIKAAFNEAAKLNLVEGSKYPILDFLGRYKKCDIISAQYGYDRLQINLNTTFSYDITINQGFEVTASDSLYIFETTKDLIIPVGESSGIVEIKSQEALEAVNNYSAGEINTVFSSNLSFIESVQNLDGVSGGADEETDDSYIQRILLAPESYSVAGPDGAYIYQAKSAHSSILDVQTEVLEENITVSLDGSETIVEKDIEGDSFKISIDNLEEELTLTLNQDIEAGSVIKVKIPHPYKIKIYVLTQDDTTADSVLEAVEETLAQKRPLADYVIVESAKKETFTIAGTVYLYQDADYDTVSENIQSALQNFIDKYGNSLKESVLINQIITCVCSVEGVYDFIVKTPKEDLEAYSNICYKGSIGEITYERVDLNE